MTDSARLARDASRGDQLALDELLVRHLPALEAYVRLKAGRLVRAKQSISDVVQSVCVEVLRQADRFDYRGEGAFRNWLCKQALHKIISKKRFLTAAQRDAARERSESSAGLDRPSVLTCYATICSPSKVAMGHEAAERFERAFEQLNDDYREAITLYRVVGLSYPEIAEEMDRSEGAVRNLVYRGLAQLSRLLEGPSEA